MHDNPALLEALAGSKTLYPVFVFDPWFAGNGKYVSKCLRLLLIVHVLKNSTSAAVFS